MTLPITCRRGQTYKSTKVCFTVLCLSAIGGDRRTKIQQVGTDEQSSIGWDRQTKVQQVGTDEQKYKGIKNTQDGDAQYFQTNTQGGDAQYTNTISKFQYITDHNWS